LHVSHMLRRSLSRSPGQHKDSSILGIDAGGPLSTHSGSELNKPIDSALK
jgi:hypothetical protein